MTTPSGDGENAVALDPHQTAAPKSAARLFAVLPRHCTRPDALRAGLAILAGFATVAAALAFATWTWVEAPWLAPASWLVSGTAFMSCFVLGHDCGHQSLTPSRRANVALGHLFMLPAGFPFHPWLLLHEAHHRHANRLGTGPGYDFDAAWNPMTVDAYCDLLQRHPFRARRYRWIRRVPPLGSLAYLLAFHFSPRRFPGRDRPRILGSYLFLLGSAVLIAGLLAASTGSLWASLLHFWLLPSLCFHGWLALYTLTQHVSPQTAFHGAADWTPYRGQVESTLNCLYPAWLSILHGRVDHHVVHHVAPCVPSYRLREANRALLDSGHAGCVKQLRFSVRWFASCLRQCQLWDEAERRYVSFAEIDRGAAR